VREAQHRRYALYSENLPDALVGTIQIDGSRPVAKGRVIRGGRPAIR